MELQVFPKPSASNRQQRGSAMVYAVFVLLLLTMAGIGLLLMSHSEVIMSRADLYSKKAFYLAEAGLEDARASLFATNGARPFSDDLETAAGDNRRIDFDPQSIQPVYDADGRLVRLLGFGDDVPLRAPVQYADGWYAAFLTNDSAEGRGNTTDEDGVVTLVAVGIVPGRAIEVVEAVIRKNNLFQARPPATITLLGPAPRFEGGRSRVKNYVGDDCNGDGDPDLFMPVVGTIGPRAAAEAERGLTRNPDYKSGGFTKADVFADLLDLEEPTVGSVPHEDWTDCQKLWRLVEEAREIADNICSGSLECTKDQPCGDCDPRKTGPDSVTFVDGDYRIRGNLEGAGLLVVTGHAEFGGGVDWRGLILSVGQGSFRVDGSGTGLISGGIVIANIAGADGNYGHSCTISGTPCWSDGDCRSGESCVYHDDNCTGGENGFGRASYDERGGGNGATTYCTTHLDLSNPSRPYEILSFLQH